jgi:hypothetical protein
MFLSTYENENGLKIRVINFITVTFQLDCMFATISEKKSRKVELGITATNTRMFRLSEVLEISIVIAQ